MSSRNTLSLILSAMLALALLPAGTAWSAAAPADSTAPAAAASDSSAAKPPEAAAPAADSLNAAESSSKNGSKDSSAKSGSKQSASAKKSAKKSKPKAAAGGKGTVKTVDAATKAGTMPVKPDVLPQHVQVQHVLIGFSGSVPGKAITRSKDEAKKVAYEILDRARKGEDFNELVRKYTDDSPPGIYGMAGTGVAKGPGEFSRDGMVAAFGNVGFNISPGNIGIADYDPVASPFGWHIIKRLK